MGLNARLRQFLDDRNVPCATMPHREVFTAREVATATHVAERELAKVVVVRGEGGGHLMVVLPPSCRIDLQAVRHATGRRHLALATEAELGQLFPDCEMGAMPPFGNLYGMPVYVDGCLKRAGEIFFQAGNHHEVAHLPYGEYERLTTPVVGEFCLHEREKDVGC